MCAGTWWTATGGSIWFSQIEDGIERGSVRSLYINYFKAQGIVYFSVFQGDRLCIKMVKRFLETVARKSPSLKKNDLMKQKKYKEKGGVPSLSGAPEGCSFGRGSKDFGGWGMGSHPKRIFFCSSEIILPWALSTPGTSPLKKANYLLILHAHFLRLLKHKVSWQHNRDSFWRKKTLLLFYFLYHSKFNDWKSIYFFFFKRWKNDFGKKSV